jgi:hypothetical protein
VSSIQGLELRIAIQGEDQVQAIGESMLRVIETRGGADNWTVTVRPPWRAASAITVICADPSPCSVPTL